MKLLVAFLFTLLVLILLRHSAFAQPIRAPGPASIASESEDPCERIKTRLANTIDRLKQEADRRETRWSGQTDRLLILIKQLQTNGYNISQLQVDLSKTYSLQNLISIDYANLLSVLSKMQNISCSYPADKTFMESNASRAQTFHKTMIADTGLLQDFFKNRVTVDLLALVQANQP